jgi:curved DNA-binding protein CbpA
MSGDPFAVLGLAHGASDEQAKAAFRMLIKKCHPDLQHQLSTHNRRRLSAAHAEAQTKMLNEALDSILSGRARQQQNFRRQGVRRDSPGHYDRPMTAAEREVLYKTRQPWRAFSTQTNLRLRLAAMMLLVTVGMGSKIADMFGYAHWAGRLQPTESSNSPGQRRFGDIPSR